ncbi:hypothetical protein VTJ83DRAFT_3415 [Remersonia thermophila]|uniref:S-adenosyl-L-methionine-dependent methyltransferase n=1 Tax=Remersonia thermophila TaxID=72144 RepID=A0ABR4DE25_9PEZI
MPRLPPSLFWRARKDISPFAPVLLPVCRDLTSTANELRWIREHVRDTPSPVPDQLRVWDLVEKRGKGVPLQYVLGNQPFGDLDIRCRPGVLIPRPETESYTLQLASLLARDRPPPSSLSILDLCTGTGCIPLLLLHALLRTLPRPVPITVRGVDICPHAVQLARENLRRARARLSSTAGDLEGACSVAFLQHDIFDPSLLRLLANPEEAITTTTTTAAAAATLPQPLNPGLDLLTINPPYISPRAFARSTARAVRNHEPRLALVPEPLAAAAAESSDSTLEPHDVFYARALAIADALRPKRMLMEVGGLDQALRVVRFFLRRRRRRPAEGLFKTVEVWRDEPAAGDRGERMAVEGTEVTVRGEGLGRAVYFSVF